MTASTTTTIPRPEPSTPPEPIRPRGPIVAIATWSARHRWTALLLWIAFVAAAIVGGGAVGSKEIDDEEEAVGASAAADRALLDAEFGDLPSESVLVQNASGGQLDAAGAGAALAELNDGLAGVAGVAAVSEPVPSSDGTSQLVEVTLSEGTGTDEEKDEAASEAARDVKEVVTDVAAAHPDMRVEQVGDATIGDALDKVYDDDLAKAEFLSVPVTLVILLLAFGALIAAVRAAAAGAVRRRRRDGPVRARLAPGPRRTRTCPRSILLVGMAVGVDYSLFYIRREREERLKGRGTYDAIAVAAATSGRAVVVSGRDGDRRDGGHVPRPATRLRVACGGHDPGRRRRRARLGHRAPGAAVRSSAAGSTARASR